MPANTAAWLPASQAAFEVKPAPYTPPREGEIVVKNHAVAINPIDWVIPILGNVKGLGASQVFDYNSKTVVQDVIAAFQGKTLAGALAVERKGSSEFCVDIVHACNGTKFVSTDPSARRGPLTRRPGADRRRDGSGLHPGRARRSAERRVRQESSSLFMKTILPRPLLSFRQTAERALTIK